MQRYTQRVALTLKLAHLAQRLRRRSVWSHAPRRSNLIAPCLSCTPIKFLSDDASGRTDDPDLLSMHDALECKCCAVAIAPKLCNPAIHEPRNAQPMHTEDAQILLVGGSQLSGICGWRRCMVIPPKCRQRSMTCMRPSPIHEAHSRRSRPKKHTEHRSGSHWRPRAKSTKHS